MNITIEDIKEYKSELTNPKERIFFIKIFNKFDDLGIEVALKLMLVVFVFSLVLLPFFGRRVVDIPMYFCLFSMFFAMLNSCLVVLFDFGKRINKLARKMSKGIYKGSLSDIFDLNCKTTKSIMNSEKQQLSKLIFDNKGITGDMIVDLLDRIEYEKQKEYQEQRDKEEREALISAGTPIGSILKEVSEI